nr:hypothetical protein [Robertkochia solimangrovi]
MEKTSFVDHIKIKELNEKCMSIMKILTKIIISTKENSKH